MKKMIFGAVAVLGIAGAATAQDALAYWSQNNNNLSGGGFGFEVGNFPQPADFGLQAGSAALTLGGGDVLANVNGVYTWLQSFSGAGGSNLQFGEPTGGTIAIQNGTDGVNNGAFLELSFNASLYENIMLSFDARRTSSGFSDVDIDAYDGSTLLGSIAADQDWNSSALTLYSFSTNLLDGVENAVIRFTFNGGSTTSSTGNNRYDNFFIQGDLIPTPGTVGLLGLAGLAAVRRRR